MPTTEVGVCNLALSFLGVTRQIQSFDDGSTEAAQCKLHYTAARNALLVAHDWFFARKAAALTEVSETTHPIWPVLYQMPSDCLRPIRLTDGEQSGEAQEFSVVVVAGQRYIGAKTSGLYLEYVVLADDEASYPPGFVTALAWALAVRLAPALAHNAGLAQNAFAMYRQALAEAKLEDARSGFVSPPVSTRYKGAR